MEERGLGVVINMKDFEVGEAKLHHDTVENGMWQRFAEPMLSKVALAYYASAGDDEISERDQGMVEKADDGDSEGPER